MTQRKVSVRVRFELETSLDDRQLEQIVLDTLAVSSGELAGLWVEAIEPAEQDEPTEGEASATLDERGTRLDSDEPVDVEALRARLEGEL